MWYIKSPDITETCWNIWCTKLFWMRWAWNQVMLQVPRDYLQDRRISKVANRDRDFQKLHKHILKCLHEILLRHNSWAAYGWRMCSGGRIMNPKDGEYGSPWCAWEFSYCSKCGQWDSSMGIIWNIVRNTECQASPQTCYTWIFSWANSPEDSPTQRLRNTSLIHCCPNLSQ